MKHLLAFVVEGGTLDESQAREAFELIMTGQATPVQAAALLGMLQQRGPTVDEIVGAASVMREKVTPAVVPDGLTAIDVVGTGGDHSGTFNISTSAAIVAAAAGRPHGVVVAKHGNKAVTSNSGASQALDALGVKLQITGDRLTKCLDEAGIGFCFAPLHHPAMKFAAPIRAELGFRTIFNILGPLTNPAGAKRMVMGVFAPAMTQSMAQVLARLGADRAMVVHGLVPDADGRHTGGMDELSTCGRSYVSHVMPDGTITDDEVDPAEFGLSLAHPQVLHADGPQHSAKIIRGVLDGQPGAPRDIVCLNAGAALVVAGLAASLAEGFEQAAVAIDSGAAKQTLEKLVAITQADRGTS